MALVDDIEQALIQNHLKDPTELSLYTRDLSTLAFRAIRTQSMEEHNAFLSAAGTAMAWLLAQHIDEEDFLDQFSTRIREQIHEVRLIIAEYEKQQLDPIKQ